MPWRDKVILVHLQYTLTSDLDCRGHLLLPIADYVSLHLMFSLCLQSNHTPCS